jgi:hypothetical protein
LRLGTGLLEELFDFGIAGIETGKSLQNGKSEFWMLQLEVGEGDALLSQRPVRVEATGDH